MRRGGLGRNACWSGKRAPRGGNSKLAMLGDVGGGERRWTTMGMAEIPEGWWKVCSGTRRSCSTSVSLESPASIQLRFQHGGLCDGGLAPHSSDLRPRGGMPWLDRNWHPVVLRTSTCLGLTPIPGRGDLNAPYPKGDSPEAAPGIRDPSEGYRE